VAGEQPGDGPAVGLVVGLGGPQVRPQALPLAPGTGALVAGSPGSGRTQALASLAGALAERGAGHLLLDAWTPDAAALVADRPGACVLVDGPLPLPPDLDDALSRHLVHGRTLRRSAAADAGSVADGCPGTVVLACEPGQVVTAYAGVLADLRVHRTGLLLGGLGPGDGEGFGLRLPPRPAGPPGRGLLVVRGRAVTVQVALPDP
jgi:S-DNA-T family DNA segregation ATPase FtsK/SpoIIIE